MTDGRVTREFGLSGRVVKALLQPPPLGLTGGPASAAGGHPIANYGATTRVAPIGANISAFTYDLTPSVSLPGLTGQSSNPCRPVVT